MRVQSVEKPDLPPFETSPRFHHEIVYFMTPEGDEGVPKLNANEYWIRLHESRTWLEDGVFLVVSPLDAESKAEIELSEEQEEWLEWMVANELQHVRIER